MKRRDLIKSLAMTALGGGAFLIGSNGASAAQAGTIQEGIAIGQTIQYDKGLKLKFVAVRNDSRCPQGAMCIWEGDAVVVLEAHLPNQAPRTYKLHTNLKPRSVSIPSWPPGMFGFKTYGVRLVSLTPRPRIGKTIKPSDYRLTLDIEVYY